MVDCSDIEEQGSVMCQSQLKATTESTVKAAKPTFQFSTERIFVPRTKDMEQDFYRPSEVKDTMSGEEDLTHLAPSMGDVADTQPTPRMFRYNCLSLFYI